LKLSKEFSYKS